ncbi:MAG: cytochrome c biogenesis protein CcsA [Bacteroidota bacterium]
MKRESAISIGYKSLAVLLLLYTLIFGLTNELPYQAIWEQSARNFFFHVPNWTVLIVLMGISLVQSLRVLRSYDPDLKLKRTSLELDVMAVEAAKVGIMFCIAGLVSGMIWARVTWGSNLPASDFAAWWNWDPKQTCALIAFFIYLGYFLLRTSFADPEQRAKVAAAYNIFAFATLIPLLFIIPDRLPGLHPTAEQGSQLVQLKVDATFTTVFFPAMIGFILLGYWIYEVRYRMGLVQYRLDEIEAERAYNEV